jgi:hypothetical protein
MRGGERTRKFRIPFEQVSSNFSCACHILKQRKISALFVFFFGKGVRRQPNKLFLGKCFLKAKEE